VQHDSAGVQGSPAGLQQGPPGGAIPRVQTEVHWDQAHADPVENPLNGPPNEDFAPLPMDVHNNNPQEATVVFVEIEQVTGKAYSDQTGKFLAPSATGSNYVMFFFMNMTATPSMQSRSRTIRPASSSVRTLLLSNF
jgi:hypothetical protein